MADEDQTDASEDAPKKTPPTVRRVGEWHLVIANDYQVSIGPDAVIQLPRHIHPDDVPDFVAAITVAADVANGVHTGNIEAAKDDDRSLAQRKAIVAHGGAPVGTTRMQVAARQSEQATIGRATRRGRGSKTSTPVSAVKAKEPALTRQQKASLARKAAKEAAAQTADQDTETDA